MTKEAQDFLRAMLADGASLPQKEIHERGADLGFTQKQLRTAREKLNVVVEKSGMDGGWCWKMKLPPAPLPAPRGKKLKS